jgi:hypothetical protein
VPSQLAVPFGGAKQVWQLGPHEVVAVMGSHEVAVVPYGPGRWQRTLPTVQVKSHAPDTHVDVAFGGMGHDVQAMGPQLSTLVFDPHVAPQRWFPGAQSKSHWPASQVAVAFVGVVHGAQAVGPQVATAKFETQALPHWCWPAGHKKPQVAPSHVAVAPTGVVQVVHELPHEPTLLLSTHCCPQRW